MSGNRTFARPAATGQIDAEADMVNMSAADMAVLQDYISGRTEFEAAAGKASGEKTVNVGLVEMKASDVADIEHQVRQERAKRIAQFHKKLSQK